MLGTKEPTLTNINTNVGTFGAANIVPVITASAKGFVTAVTTATITPAAIGAYSGTEIGNPDTDFVAIVNAEYAL